MTDDLPPNPALLPAGLRDLLPPDAETEASAVEALMTVFAAHGYQRVKPPLLEFEDSLLAGSGVAVSDQTFRLMDPDSHRMMGLRADTTPQVARIATTRLAKAPRPLRLSYAGQCLRVRGNQLAPDRQVAQAGVELIGHDSPEADAETVLVAAEALAAVGLTRVSFDLTLPMLVPSLLDDAGLADADRVALARALDRKDHPPWRGAGASADRTAAVRRPCRSCPGGAGRCQASRPSRPARRTGRRHGSGDQGCLPGSKADRRSRRIPRFPVRNGRFGDGLCARAARRTRPRWPVHLR